MLTGLCSHISQLVAFESGATDYLIKPFNPEELVSKVEKLLGRSQRLLAGRTNPERKHSHPHKKSSPASSGDK
jgi:DNA-binding response OmpR family regulator